MNLTTRIKAAEAAAARAGGPGPYLVLHTLDDETFTTGGLFTPGAEPAETYTAAELATLELTHRVIVVRYDRDWGSHDIDR